MASFPRSGQHWARFQICELLTGSTAGFDTIDEVIPPIGRHGGAPLIVPRGGRLIQTHHQWREEYTRAIYIVRDIRDVALSVYAGEEGLGLTSHFDIHNFSAYLEPWLCGKVQTMGNWQNHILSWLDSPIARNGNLLVLRFEDLRQTTNYTLSRIMNFLGVPVSVGTLERTIAHNCLAAMRQKEDEAARFRNRPTTSDEHRFVRSGIVGGWQARLTPDQIQLIERYAEVAMRRLQYPLSTASGEPTANVTTAI